MLSLGSTTISVLFDVLHLGCDHDGTSNGMVLSKLFVEERLSLPEPKEPLNTLENQR